MEWRSTIQYMHSFFFLKLNELLQCSERISQMYISCRLNA